MTLFTLAAWTCCVPGVSITMTQSQVTHVSMYPMSGRTMNERFGSAIGTAGDINGDGFDDLIVGSPNDSSFAFEVGSVRVFSGEDGIVLLTLHGTLLSDHFGTAVSSAGDTNNDGVGDLIIGAPDSDQNGMSSGSAQVISGLTGELLHVLLGEHVEDAFGSSVGCAGDVNNDGFDDLIVGSYNESHLVSRTGGARVFSGADGSLLYEVFGESPFDYLGYAVDTAGDINLDGFDDFVVSAYLDDDNGIDSGTVRFYSGIDGSLIRVIKGESAADYFGFSVCHSGDVDNDGWDDVIVGAMAMTQTAPIAGAQQ